jgi:hypothetical protein
VGPTITCATPDLLLQHPDEHIATYVYKQIKHLEHTLETPLQHVQHPDLLLKHASKTLAT